jgi:hypothetical protein
MIRWAIIAATLPLLGSPGVAAETAGSTEVAATSSVRKPRAYAQCNSFARQRSLSGGDRRRFVTRCTLGYPIPPIVPPRRSTAR